MILPHIPQEFTADMQVTVMEQTCLPLLDVFAHCFGLLWT
jgi:hypothetical protein